MELEPGTSSRAGERPVTRWRREHEDTSNNLGKSQRPSTGVNVSQNKFERPRSRRGTKDEIPDTYSTFGSNRSATPSRNALARPPSASILSNRVSTAGTRLNTSAFGHLNTGLSIPGQITANGLERPITQQGIAGVRPGTNRGLPMTRQIQDKRYYISLMQLKIRELNQELSVIMKDIDNQNKERATYLHYDKRAKDLASELTALQGELADYNIVVDKMTSDVDKETIEREAEDLALKNERTLMEIERMFEERKDLEQGLVKMERQLENEKKRTERLIETMDASTRRKYDELIEEKMELQDRANKMQQELDKLSKEQVYFEEEIALSPLKQEAVKLHLKIIEVEEKREKLRADEKNRLSPEEEKERLLKKIKQDNMDITAAEAQLAEKEKRTVEAEQELEQLETDIEDTQSEKQVKYKELRKREEIMEQFMSTFEQNKEDEIKKLEKLEKTIVTHLEAISNAQDVDVDFAVGEEMAILHDVHPYDNYEYVNHDKSFDGLTKEYLKLQETLNKMMMLEQKLKMESKDLNEKISKRQSKLITLEDLDGLKVKTNLKQKELTTEFEQLKKQQSLYEQELKTIQDKYEDMKQRLGTNEIYNQIDLLENKLEKLKEDHKKIEDFIKEQEELANYDTLKEQVFNLISEYSKILKENLKSVY